ncbi:MAG: coiled coil domain-containing protein [Desulfuromonadaceae bacterium]|nr:coiled coil domain-containing protein [Desulfuromonas sp.]MDY0184943.1 coiled coil domain-containing protein [Desulfuromonadaceae bacterium]
MDKRQIYIDKMKAKLDEWNADISKLQAKADGASANMQLKFRQEVEHLKQQRAEAAEKLAALQKASDSAWEDLKVGLENSWHELGKSVTSAWSKFN